MKLMEGKATYDVNVAKLVQPEVVCDTSRNHEVALFKLLIDLLSGNVQFV